MSATYFDSPSDGYSSGGTPQMRPARQQVSRQQAQRAMHAGGGGGAPPMPRRQVIDSTPMQQVSRQQAQRAMHAMQADGGGGGGAAPPMPMQPMEIQVGQVGDEEVVRRVWPNNTCNAFAITVLVISIVSIIVCILVVFLVKPCPLGWIGAPVPCEPEQATGAASAASTLHEPDTAAGLDALTSTGKSMVMFHAPWCGHCKAMLPEYKNAVADMAKACPGLKVVALNGDKVRDALKKHDIKGFPTLKIFVDGKATEYQGDRSVKSLVDFVKKHC
jgi:protein disulfide-isomerase-like protein